MRPTSGRAWVAGIDVAAAPARVHQHIGVVPQRNTLDRRLNVRDNLIFHGRYFGMRPAVARNAAARLLDQVSLADAAGKRVDELSGGLARRLMIARAIMHRPEVQFLDEPTTGLDPQSRLAVHGIITGLQAAGQTILLITHDMADALAGPLTVTATCVELTVMRRNRAPSAQMVSVLRALAADPSRWRYGYDLGTEVHLKSGSLYPILVRLADRGLLEASWEPGPAGRPPRHLYRLSPAGREYVAALGAARASRPVPHPRGRWSEA